MENYLSQTYNLFLHTHFLLYGMLGCLVDNFQIWIRCLAWTTLLTLFINLCNFAVYYASASNTVHDEYVQLLRLWWRFAFDCWLVNYLLGQFAWNTCLFNWTYLSCHMGNRNPSNYFQSYVQRKRKPGYRCY